jgi:hypothetical protein
MERYAGITNAQGICLIIALIVISGLPWNAISTLAGTDVIAIDEPPGGYVVGKSPVVITGTVSDPSITTIYMNKLETPVIYRGRLRTDLPGVPFPVINGRFTGTASFLSRGGNMVRVMGFDAQHVLHEVDVPVTLNDAAIPKPDVTVIANPLDQREAAGAPVEYSMELRNRTNQAQTGTYDVLVSLPDGTTATVARQTPYQLQPNQRLAIQATVNTASFFEAVGLCQLTVIVSNNQAQALSQDSFWFETYRPADFPFTDATAPAGLRFLHSNGGEGGGLSWADYDNDGFPDLFVTNLNGPGALFHNNGDGTFTKATQSAGLTKIATTNASIRAGIWGDYDNDGYKDLFLTRSLRGNLLYHNNGNGTFTEVSSTAGVNRFQATSAAAWGDYDNDGWLDLYVAGFINSGQLATDFTGITTDLSHLYHNNHDGTFTDIATAAGLDTQGPTWAVLWLDYDGDGDLDLFIVNDFGAFTGFPNTIYRNDGPDGRGGWTFTNMGPSTHFSDVPIFGMGMAADDYDHDGDLDIFTTNIGLPVLYRRDGDIYTDATFMAGVGIAHPMRGPYANENWLTNTWGNVWWDYDLDGWADLYVGSSGMSTANFALAPFNPNFLFHNNGDGTFTNVAEPLGLDHPGRTRGVALADFDRDGDLDLALLNSDEYLVLMRNDLPRTNTWLQVELHGTISNRDAIGSTITVIADGLRQWRPYPDASPMCSQSTLETIFGLGQARVIDRLEVRWPSGRITTKTDVPVNQRLVITEPRSSN